ncbi:radical SAM protein [Candidatus Woesearchaeota archaeon]|nr:radical SAM protein [Candidatus Woesearchaeota archaeon]
MEQPELNLQKKEVDWGKSRVKKRINSSIRYISDIIDSKNPLKPIYGYELEMTLGCNLKCKFCFQDKFRNNNYDHKDMDFNEIKKLLYKIKPKRILLTGGEAMIRKDFFDVLDVLKKLKTKCHILSNGSLFDDGKIEKMKKYENITEITFSLDYFDHEKHDKLRGKKGTYKSIMNAVDKLKDIFTLSISSILFEDNIEEVKEIVKYFTKKGIFVNIYVNEFYSNSEADETKKRLSYLFSKKNEEISLLITKKEISLKEVEKLNKNIEDFREFLGKYKKANFLPEYLNKTKQKAYGTFSVKGTCGYANRIRFNNKGQVIVCEKIHETLGDPKRNSISDIWNSEKYKRLREHFSRNIPLPICKTCAKFKAV